MTDDDQHDSGVDELENLGGNPQGDELAGNDASRGNDEEDLEGPHNDDEDPGDDSGDENGPPLARARQQAARYRRELRETETERDDLAAALWTERVRALGVLADPDDLPLDAAALHDPDRLRELADELVTRKPHLRSRRIITRAGQGEGTNPAGFSLAAILNRGA